MILEREPVLRRIDDLLDDAVAGRGRLVALGGEAGVGKSTVVRAVVATARERVQVRIGHCDNVAAPAALGPVLEALPEVTDLVERHDDRATLHRRLHEGLGRDDRRRPHHFPGRTPASLAKKIRQWLGDSRGRWEGNTLVVETTNFTDKTNFRGSGENLRVVERFTRADDGTLLYQFTVDDPQIVYDTLVRRNPDEESGRSPCSSYACHEANSSMENMLTIARDEEKAAEEAARSPGRWGGEHDEPAPVRVGVAARCCDLRARADAFAVQSRRDTT